MYTSPPSPPSLPLPTMATTAVLFPESVSIVVSGPLSFSRGMGRKLTRTWLRLSNALLKQYDKEREEEEEEEEEESTKDEAEADCL